MYNTKIDYGSELFNASKQNNLNFSLPQLNFLHLHTTEKIRLSGYTPQNPQELALEIVKKALSFNENFSNTLRIANALLANTYDAVKNAYKNRGMIGINNLLESSEIFDRETRYMKDNAEITTINTLAEYYKNNNTYGFKLFLSTKNYSYTEFNNLDEKTKTAFYQEYAKNRFNLLLEKYDAYEIFEEFPEEMPQFFLNLETNQNPQKIVGEYKQKVLIAKTFEELYKRFEAEKVGMSFEAFKYGLTVYLNAKEKGILNRTDVFTIIDYSKPSNEKRLFVLDMTNHKVFLSEFVSHGKGNPKNGFPLNSNEKVEYVGNEYGSNLSPVGLHITKYPEEHQEKGFILRVEGVEKGYNEATLNRGVFFHESPYSSEEYIKRNNYAGRSWGCFTTDPKKHREIVESISGGSGVFVYFDDEDYIQNSVYIKNEAKVLEFVKL
ncbi:murein L,D-transpeptidase catalytic domain family protein [Candidatus Micrarchaeota archaeon]|nr:murein L,D-transpeptidase catalytic domain family protein [Candidatus Micrarchaeota archaeon]